jgi:hypothetical protein
MMANRHGRSDTASVDEDQRQALESFSDHVRACVDRATAFGELFSDLEQAHIQGQAVQTDLNAVFEESDSLATIARLDLGDSLEGGLDDAVEHGLLQPTEREAFDELWDDIDWIAPGVRAFDSERSGDPRHWTGKDISFDTVQGELVVEHTLEYGVDTVHRLRIPVKKFFLDSVQRLQMISRVLPVALEKGDLDPEALARIVDTQSDLVEVIEQLDQVAPDGGDEQGQDDSAGDDVAQELAALFGEAAGEEGESDSDPDDQTERDGASLGFE